MAAESSALGSLQAANLPQPPLGCGSAGDRSDPPAPARRLRRGARGAAALPPACATPGGQPGAASRIDRTTALRLEQVTLNLQDLEASHDDEREPLAPAGGDGESEALRLMEKQHQLRVLQLQLQELRRAIQDGLDSGDPVSWNPEGMEGEGRRRLGAHDDSRLSV